MRSNLVDNALDFVERAAAELWSEELDDEQQLKYSTVHLFQGAELVFKTRLMEEGPEQILTDPSNYDEASFNRGDFRSVGFKRACVRLEEDLGVEIPTAAKEAIGDLGNLRNRYTHFVCDEPRELVLAVQLRAWHYLVDLFERDFLSDLKDDQRAKIRDINEEMRRSEDFLEARYEEIRGDLESLAGEGLVVARCATCGHPAQVLGDGYPECRVCRASSHFAGAADEYARSNDPFWKHPKHGVDDERAWCSECGEDAVVPAGEGTVDAARERSGYESKEPGEDPEFFLCFSCGAGHTGFDIRSCGSCGAHYTDRERNCPACGRF